METEVYQSVYVRYPYCKATIPKVAGGVIRCPECGKKVWFRKEKAAKRL